MRRSAGRAAAVLVIVFMGCGHAAVGPSAPVADEQVAARLSLGALGEPLGTTASDELERLRRLFELEYELGNAVEAQWAAWRYLEVLGGLAATERLPRASVASKQQRVRIAELAGAMGNVHLVIAALSPIEQGDPQAARYLEAARRVRNITDSTLYETAWRLAEKKPEIQLRLETARAFFSESSLPVTSLRKLGPRAAGLLWMRLHAALASDSLDPGYLDALAAALLAVDPLDVRASLVRTALAEAQRGVLELDAGVLADLALASEAPGNLVRLERLVAAAPTSQAAPAALAFAAIQAGVSGDAVEMLPKVREPALRQQARALAALQLGDLDAYRLWRRANRGRDSVYLAHVEASYWQSEVLAQRTLAEVAIQRLVARDWPVYDNPVEWHRLRQVASDAEAPAALRELALQRLHWMSRDAAALLADCKQRKATTSSCRRRLQALDALDSENDGATEARALRVITDWPALPSSALRVLASREPDVVRSLADVTESLARGRLGLTEEVVYGLLHLALVRGDAVAMRRHLRERGGLIASWHRTVYREAAADLEDGVDGAQLLADLWFADWPIEPLPRLSSSSSRETLPASAISGRVAQLSRAMKTWSSGNSREVLEALAPLLEQHDEPLIMAMAAQAARRSGDRAQARELARWLPASSHWQKLDAARTAASAGDWAVAKTHFADLLWRYGSGVSQEWAVAVAHNAPGSDGAQFLARRLPKLVNVAPPWLLPALRDGSLGTGAEVAVHINAAGDAERAAAVPVAKVDEVAWSAYEELREAISSATSGAEAVALAREAVTRLGRSSWTGQWPLAALRFLAGDGVDAVRMALVPSDERQQRPTALGTQIEVLAAEREAGVLDDEFAWKLWKLEQHETYAEVRQQAYAAAASLFTLDTAGTHRAACRIFIDLDEPMAAAPACVAAWRAGYADEDLGVAMTWLLLNQPGFIATLAGALDEVAAQVAERMPTDGQETGWLVNVASFWWDRNRLELAASAISEAWARGLVPEAMDNGADVEPLLPHMPLLTRWRRLQGDVAAERAEVYSRLGWLALRTGEVNAARAYLDAASIRGSSSRRAAALVSLRRGHLALLEADLASKALDPEEARWLGLEASDADFGLATVRYPRAATARLAWSRWLAQHGQSSLAASVIEPLLQSAPHNPAVLAVGLPSLAASGGAARASQLLRAARTQAPDDAALQAIALPAAAVGPP